MLNLFEAIDSHIQNYDSKLFTAIPAEILEVTSESGIKYVKVKPTINKLYSDGVVASLPDIPKVPVVFPSGGGGLLSFPLAVGDTVLVIFSQSNITDWVNGDGKAVTPETLRSHSINDAIAIPCLYPFDNNLEPNDTDVELKYNDSTILLKKDGGVEVTTSSGDVDITTASKFSVTNDSEELISLLSEIIDEVSKITTSTMYGAATIINNKAAFTALKTRLDKFKK